MEKEPEKKCFNCGAVMTYSKLRNCWFCELCGATETPLGYFNKRTPDYIR